MLRPELTVQSGKGTSFDFRLGNSAVRYVRLQFISNGGSGNRWLLTIRDSNLRVLDTVSDAQQSAGLVVWTKRIYTDGRLLFELAAESADGTLKLSQAIVMPEGAEQPYYSLRDSTNPKFKPLYESDTEFRRLGDHVGFLTASSPQASWCCSGVAVGEDLFLTNFHCDADYAKKTDDEVWAQDVCDRTFVDFSWDGDRMGREFRCAQVVSKNRASDYALLRLAPSALGDRLTPARLRVDTPRKGEFVRIVHHPACRPKQLSSACTIEQATRAGWTGAGNRDFGHSCDTEGGSSGAPVYDTDNRVIGIHHLGFALGADGQCDFENKGTSIQGILESSNADTRALLQKAAGK